MTEKTCGTCKHWAGKPGDFGTCEKICHDGKEKAYTRDSSDYYSALSCSDDFGCVLHEAKGDK